jgi:hypothetical protein
VIRGNGRKLKIAWITPTIGTFGAIREIVEVSNVLIGKGHKVYIYHPEGGECKWLKCLAECRKLNSISFDSFDVLIGILDWKPELYEDFLSTKSTIKAICLLGFEPTEQMAQALRGETSSPDKAQRMILDSIQKKFLILADSSWQVEWVKKNVGYAAGPAFGGINLTMFYPSSEAKPQEEVRIIYSGDPRERKGTDTVEAAIEAIRKAYGGSKKIIFDYYWGKKFTQDGLVNFIQKGDIFLDGHRRAGWCNPVAEAIACGCVPVCTDIGAVRDFAINDKTALVVPVDSPEAMAAAAIELIEDEKLRKKLSKNGLNLIQKFSYDNVVPVLEKVLVSKIYD